MREHFVPSPFHSLRLNDCLQIRFPLSPKKRILSFFWVMIMAALPPFSDLLAFNAAARHGSFTRAARELNVTQPAISRRVAALEADLRLKLFDRTTKPTTLTPAGKQLMDALCISLSQLETVVLDLRRQSDSGRISISAAPGFLSFWLVPRLTALRQAFPDLEFSLMTGDHGSGDMLTDIDIRFGAGDWPGRQSNMVLSETVFAVCSPLFLASRDAPLDMAAILQGPLLDLSDPFNRWYRWSTWLAALKEAPSGKLNTLEFDSYSTLISAALAGHGIALCWSGLLDQYLETGSLLRVSEQSVISDRGYYVTVPYSAARNAKLGQVIAWLIRESNRQIQMIER
ncbi:LysR substrate-binding domain-containing protein [Paracoccus sp. TOH]|uniref:LysR substrate-binding domain-containing protein n=1 Tax=Paracoccus sp. TOH TaxID=1263728 RepID=UPI0025AF0C1C|nr:LysR substrate-binding domain-containing protein [Paracoccus sp. TOH]WJS84393.1 LysR substrate-binding domain-containing protein [Paracoccus sp. TOH]